MRKRLFLFILITASLFYFFRNDEPSPPASQTKIVKPPSIPKPKAPKAPLKEKVVKEATLKPHTVSQLPSQPLQPPKGTVSFEIKEGHVVAFGDVLIGKPNRPEFPQEGYIEAPKPQYWPAGTEIAYSLHQDMRDIERVLRVIEYFNTNTPVRLVPLQNHQDSLVFAPADDPDLCLSYVGRIGGHQPIFLGDRCSEQAVVHEIMHALGFIHEHSREDRDRFVSVKWTRIEEDKQSQFFLSPPMPKEPHAGRPFDFKSVMIYPPTAFSKEPGAPTLESVTGEIIAPSRWLSEEDLRRLTILVGP